MTEAIHASSLVSSTTLPFTGMLFEIRSKPVNDAQTARLALWQKSAILSSSRKKVALASVMFELGCV